MKIFVGTMYSGEGDWERCLAAVAGQKNVDFTHFLIQNLPEKEAHNMLWNAWRGAKANHQLFVKLDADVVLRDENTLASINECFENPRVTGMQPYVHDFFTDSKIHAGLTCFSTHVVFEDTKDDLMCDRGVDFNHDIVLRSPNLPESLDPAGYHCHHSTLLQAFHYGHHRALKNQTSTMIKVRAAWHANGHDKVRGMAILGELHAQQSREHNYTDENFNKAFDHALDNYDELITGAK